MIQRLNRTGDHQITGIKWASPPIKLLIPPELWTTICNSIWFGFKRKRNILIALSKGPGTANLCNLCDFDACVCLDPVCLAPTYYELITDFGLASRSYEVPKLSKSREASIIADRAKRKFSNFHDLLNKFSANSPNERKQRICIRSQGFRLQRLSIVRPQIGSSDRKYLALLLERLNWFSN